MRPGACWSVQLVSRSPCAFIDAHLSRGSHSDGNPAMNRRTHVLFMAVGPSRWLSRSATTLARGPDHHHPCEAGFPTLISCTFT